MPDIAVPKKEESPSTYAPIGKELEVKDYVFKRIDELKEFRQLKLSGNNKSCEDIFKEADTEYQPRELTLSPRTRLESNEDTGLRSKLVKVGSSEDWQSNIASPDFYVKVNTALAILVDQNPEAVFLPSGRKWEKNTALAYANWKNSWEVSGAKQQLKNVIFNSAKYGTGVFRTYPKRIEMQKKVRTEYYKDQPEKDVYESKTLVKFDDLCRESLNPKQVWVSENARPGDYSSIDSWYFEKDYSFDRFKQEFEDFSNIEFCSPGQTVTDDKTNEEKKIKNNITVGFYEDQVNDMYVVVVPSAKIVLYHSPLPNDDGMLSLSICPWTLRDDQCIWGIGLYEIIRNDSVLYDKLLNMTLDQLVLSIYKMFFYKGTEEIGENGQLVLSPGVGKQVIDPSGMQFLEIPGPGAEAWKGLEFVQGRRDSNSGITPQLMAKFSSGTLGQDLQAKEAALERMKTPLDYILDCLQQEAYITLSWQKQILSTPEVLQYEDADHLVAALKEMGLDDQHIQQYQQEMQGGQSNGLLFSGQPDANGQSQQYANVYKEIPLNMEKDDKGEMIESDKMAFYRFGNDLPTHRLDWKGIIRIKPQSILAPSKELMRRMKLDLFNLIMPALQMMLQQPAFIPTMLPPVKQIIKVYDEDLKEWIDEDQFMQMYQAAMQPEPPVQPEPPRLSFSIDFALLTLDEQKQILEKYGGITVAPPLFADAAGHPNTGQPLFTDANNPLQGGGQQGQDFKPMVNRQDVGGGQSLGGNNLGQNIQIH